MGDYQSFNETKRCFDDKKGYCFRLEMIEQNKSTSTNTFILALVRSKQYLLAKQRR
jgi:hypothetical protein